MSKDYLSLAVRIRSDRFSPCVQYVFNLFARVHGYDCFYVSPSDPAPDAQVIISYCPDGSSHGDPAPQIPHLQITKCDFFDTGFGQQADPPADFAQMVALAKSRQLEPAVAISGKTARLDLDLVAAAFYLLSGYYDWVSKVRDEHGRVTAAQIPLPVETWDIPLVNHWFRQVDQLLRFMHSNMPEVGLQRPSVPDLQTICLTHDVDLLRKYRYSNLHRHMGRAVRSGKGKMKEEWARARQVMRKKLRDPYDSFDHIYTVKERVSAPSTFFFMGGEPGGRNGDYRIDSREARDIIIRARTGRDEIALHGSWESGEQPGLLVQERNNLQAAAKATIAGSRQHYLRMSTPETFRQLSEMGVRYDSTGGFPDRCGFKYGWSGCFHPFDLDNMKQLPVLEIPLVCMDVTLAAYEKIPAELALERLTNLLDAACDNVPGGAFVFLWHNTMGDRLAYPGYADTFEYFFSVASGATRFITLSQLCDEFEKKIPGSAGGSPAVND